MSTFRTLGWISAMRIYLVTIRRGDLHYPRHESRFVTKTTSDSICVTKAITDWIWSKLYRDHYIPSEDVMRDVSYLKLPTISSPRVMAFTWFISRQSTIIHVGQSLASVICNIDWLPSVICNIDWLPSVICNIDWLPSVICNIDWLCNSLCTHQLMCVMSSVRVCQTNSDFR